MTEHFSSGQYNVVGLRPPRELGQETLVTVIGTEASRSSMEPGTIEYEV